MLNNISAKNVRIMLLLVICLIFSFYIYNHLNDFKLLFSLNPLYLIPITILVFFRLIMRGVGLHFILLTVIPDITFIYSFKNFVISQFLPQGGTVYQGMMLKKQYGLSYKNYLALLLSYRILSTLILLLLCALVVNLFDREMSFSGVPLYLICYLLFVFFIGLLWLLNLMRRTQSKSLKNVMIYKPVIVVGEIFNRIITTFCKQKLILSIFVIVAINGIISVGILYCIFYSINSPQNLVNLIIYTTTLRLVAMVRITPSNIGVREFLIGYLASILGATVAEGVIVSIIERLLTFFTQGLISAVMSFFRFPASIEESKQDSA